MRIDGSVTRARLAAASVCAFAILTPRSASAGGPLGPQGSPIRTSQYKIDLFQGPLLASSRIMGLGGAYTAVADGAEAIMYNPASVSLRPAHSTTYDDYDLTGGIVFPSSVTGTDFDNNGRRGFTYDSFYWANVGGSVQHGHFGLGAFLSAQQYELGRPGDDVVIDQQRVDELTLRLYRFDAVASYGFFDEQLHIGGGVRVASFDAVDTTGSERLLFGAHAIGLQGGILATPYRLPLRLGFAARSPLVGFEDEGSRVKKDDAGDRRVGAFYLPSNAEVPWEVEWGVATQLGKRALNIPWMDEDKVDPKESEPERRAVHGQREPAYKAARRILKRRYWKIPRERILLSFSMLLTGPASDAVGFESVLARTVDRSGQRVSLTSRAGAEAELWPNRLVLRAGSYVEPTRFNQSSTRVHATTAFDVRLIDWTVFGLYPEDTSFRLSAAIDGARDYFGWTVGVGIWR